MVRQAHRSVTRQSSPLPRGRGERPKRGGRGPFLRCPRPATQAAHEPRRSPRSFPRSATFIGFGAIALWSVLALLTASAGAIPPFELAALTFAIGGGLGFLYAATRGRLAALVQPWPVWAVGIGGLFGYHALYFAALGRAPPAEASLIAYLWPLLTCCSRRCAGRAPARPPPHWRRARLCWRGDAVRWQSGRPSLASSTARCHRATRWRSPAPSSGRAIRCCRADSKRRRPRRSLASASPPPRSPPSAISPLKRRRAGGRSAMGAMSASGSARSAWRFMSGTAGSSTATSACSASPPTPRRRSRR